MVVWPRDALDEPAIVFRKSGFSSAYCPQNLSPTRRAGAARPGRRPRGGWLLGSLAARQCFHCTCRSTGRLASSTVLRLLSSAALKRPKPRCAAILAAMAWTAKRMPFGAKPQSVEGGRRSQHAQTNHSQPACKLQVRADSRDCSYRQAWLSAGPWGQAQQARRPSTQTPKHLAAQHSSVSERQDKEAACGPHPSMTPLHTGGIVVLSAPCLARPVLHRKSVCGTI